MLPGLSALDPRRLLDPKWTCKKLLVTRYGPPDTHGATWVCPADDPRCNDAYGNAMRGVQSLNICLEDELVLLHLVDDRERVARMLDEYEAMLKSSGILHRMLIGECSRLHKQLNDNNERLVMTNKFVWWTLLPIDQSIYYDTIDASEQVAGTGGGATFSIFGDDDVLLPSPIPNGLNDHARIKYEVDGETSFVKVAERPSVHVKTDGNRTLVRVTRTHLAETNDFYEVEYTLLARLQLGGPLATQLSRLRAILNSDRHVSDSRRVLDDDWFYRMRGVELYDESRVLVRIDDGQGHDESIIHFMKWAHDTHGVEGFRTSGMVDLRAMQGHLNTGKLNAPEILLVGKPAAIVAAEWTKRRGPFEDKYDTEMKVRFYNSSVMTTEEFLRLEPSYWMKQFFGNTDGLRARVLKAVLIALGYES